MNIYFPQVLQQLKQGRSVSKYFLTLILSVEVGIGAFIEPTKTQQCNTRQKYEKKN